MMMRVLFAGSPEVALPSLQALLSSAVDVVGVLSQPAKPVGRAKTLTDTAVTAFAKARGLPVANPQDSRGILRAVAEWSPDVAIVVAYGRLLPLPVRESVPGGWWNVHFSLLPQWRGAAPVPHAILAGDTVTGVSLFKIDAGLDTVEVAFSMEYPLPPDATATEVLSTLAHRAVEPLMALLSGLESGSVETTPQRGEPSFAPKPERSFGLLDWAHPAGTLYQRFLAATVEPGAYTLRRDNGQRVNIRALTPAPHHRTLAPGEIEATEGEVMVGTTSHPMRLLTLQPAGKSTMPAIDWFRGLPSGVILGE